MDKDIITCTLSDKQLVDKVEKELGKLIKTGGRSFTMQIPARVDDDTDLLLSELLTRFKKQNIIFQLQEVNYNTGDLSDIGNEIGIAIGKHTIEENEGIEFDIDSFIDGLKHGISLIDGTH